MMTFQVTRSSAVTYLMLRRPRYYDSGTSPSTMSDVKATESTVKEQVAEDVLEEPLEILDLNEGNSMPSSQDEEKVIKKKYGGIVPKKLPLISGDHERAFFDSADWALGKQGAPAEKPKGPLEALRPKLQPTPHQQSRSRRSVYAPTDGEDGGNTASEDVNSNE